MSLKRSKFHFICGSVIMLLGIVLFKVLCLKFLGAGITLSGLMLIFIGIYWATKRKAEIPADEMHIRINEKSGFNAFWTVMGFAGILIYVTHYSPGLLEISDVIELVFIVGMFTFVASRFYYIRRGLL
ncbi:MAG: hypothetical protein C4B59_13750 [Candidatus Methanogaster sp.]|uniref:Uncharacterized protein n=1 Tax=Candidatus Methanogaster sp. TaxID=3386292 RepID=A0AC61KZM6_9EURY|nr:MAG: hypothetical protein C4B59_13750 [ANME-2 cluster archaeon]